MKRILFFLFILLVFNHKSFAKFISAEDAFNGEPGDRQWVLDNLYQAIPFSIEKPYKLVRNNNDYGGMHSLKSYRLRVGYKKYFIKITSLMPGQDSSKKKARHQKKLLNQLKLDHLLDEAGINIVYPVHSKTIRSKIDDIEMTVYPLVPGEHFSWVIEDYANGSIQLSEFMEFLNGYYVFLGKSMAIIYKNSGGINRRGFNYLFSFWLNDRNIRNQLYDRKENKFYLLDTIDFEENRSTDVNFFIPGRHLWYLLNLQRKDLAREEEFVEMLKAKARLGEESEEFLSWRELDTPKLVEAIFEAFKKGFFSVFSPGECKPISETEYAFLVNSLKRGDQYYPSNNGLEFSDRCTTKNIIK